MRYILYICLAICASASAQVTGCTDPQSTNFNPLAVLNDGSCLYPNTTVAPVSSVVLPEVLNETSGLILWNGHLLTHNDDTDTTVYALSQEGYTIAAEYSISDQTNIDWEEIAQDEDYIYIGDFGNNATGNRTNLQILRIPKISLEQQPVVETISFAYQDQTTPVPTGANTTEYDCEAFIVTASHIYLFTKQWTSQQTTVYQLPKIPGSHVAIPTASWNVEGLITGATYLEDKNLIALAGYSSLLKPFIYLLYDYEGDNFFSGNKRKIVLPLQFHQVEGITTSDGLVYYLSNERFSAPFINIPPRLHVVDLTAILSGYIESLQIAENTPSDKRHFVLSLDRERRELTIISEPLHVGSLYILYDQNGRNVLSGTVTGQETIIDVSNLANAVYHLQIGTTRETSVRVLIR